MATHPLPSPSLTVTGLTPPPVTPEPTGQPASDHDPAYTLVFWPRQIPPEALTPDQPVASVAMVGNPNVGKSLLFGRLTGHYAQVSNLPGTTVDLLRGSVHLPLLDQKALLVDTPGVYGLSGLNEEERLAQQAVEAVDLVLNVINALTFDRDMFLTQQLLDHGRRVLVVVNQLDELASRGHKQLDLQGLADRLGVPVVACIATKNLGVAEIAQMLPFARRGVPTPELGAMPPEALVALERDGDPVRRLEVYGLRRQYLKKLVATVLADTDSAENRSGGSKKMRLSQVLGLALLHPVWGTLGVIVTLLALYQVIGVWIAGDLVDLLEGRLMMETVNPALVGFAAKFLSPKSWVFTLMFGEFGIITMTLQYVIGVMLPLVIGFYLYMAILEDCGYLPRLAVLFDGILSRIGLNGRAIIPMILGLGCVTMASVSTRMLTSERERTIASVLMAVTIPCSAQLGVILALMAVTSGLWGWVAFIAILLAIFGVMGRLLHQMLPGQSTSLLMDLPPLRWPQWGNVLKKTWIRSKGFLWDALPVFVMGSALITIAQLTGLMVVLENALSPVVRHLLLLPGESSQVFIMGMIRRDFGVAGLYTLAKSMTHLQILTSLVVITLFVPCFASASVIWKERGPREGMIIVLLSWAIAFLAGGVVAYGLGWLPL
jgi:ferrous iron transport protein B